MRVSRTAFAIVRVPLEIAMIANLSDIRAALSLPISQLYEQACSVAGRPVPQGPNEAAKFAQDCLAGAKAKAELFSKAYPQAIDHSVSLNLVATLCWFTGWHDLVSFAKRFAEISDERRPQLHESYRLATALWVLEPPHDDIPVVAMIRAYQVAFMRQMQPDIPADLRDEILTRIMRRKDDDTRSAGSPGQMPTEEIRFALEEFLGVGAERLILAMLACRPVRQDDREGWKSLRSLTVSELLDTRLAQVQSDIGFGQRGWEHAIAFMLTELEVYAELCGATSTYNPLSDDRRPALAEQTRLKALLGSLSTRVTCKDALYQIVKPVLRSTVLEALARGPGASGFFSSFYDGSPEAVERMWADDYNLYGEEQIKRLAFREPIEGYQLSVFRLRRYTEESDHRLYEVEATLHNQDDELIAKVGLVLYYGGESGSCSAGDVAWALDEHDQDDLREVGLSLARSAARGEVDEASLSRLLVIRDWEVRASDRGHGLGPTLLKEAARHATRGLPNPRVVALRLAPMQYVAPPFDNWRKEDFPELFAPFEKLEQAWNKAFAGSVLDRKGVSIIKTEYIPACHGGSDIQLAAMALATRPESLL